MRRAPEAWVPLVAGVLWLWSAADFGIVGFLFSIIPGCLLLASGFSTLLWPGDLRVPQFTSLGGALGCFFALPVFIVAGPGTALALIGLSAGSFWSAGVTSLRQELPTEAVPVPRLSASLAAKVALDDSLLAWWSMRLPMARPQDQERIAVEVQSAIQLFAERGWLEKPESYHNAPPPLLDPSMRSSRVLGIDYEHLSFESGYEPRHEEPGRTRWLSRIRNRAGHAWVLRHRDGPRPWLVCLHGFQMGVPLIDLRAFRALQLHHRRGLNVMMPVLPLHGPRSHGRVSGDGYISGDHLDLVHAQAQAVWDVRRLLSWVRAQDAPTVGVYGLSLGGYNAALIAAIDPELDSVIAGIPAVDFTRLAWRHGPPLMLRNAERLGVSRDDVQLLLSVVSPLSLAPKLPREGRFLFAGTADHIVPPDQVHDLWLHWERPRIAWYEGSHLSFMRDPEVRSVIDEALTRLKVD